VPILSWVASIFTVKNHEDPRVTLTQHALAVSSVCSAKAPADRVGRQNVRAASMHIVPCAVKDRTVQGRLNAAQGIGIPHRPVRGKGQRHTRLFQRAAQIGIIPAGPCRSCSSVGCAESNSARHMAGAGSRRRLPRSAMRGIVAANRSVGYVSIRWRASRLPLAARAAA